MKPLSTTLALLSVAALSICGSANAQNVVMDPGFEASANSDFGNAFSPAWTLNDPSGFSNAGGDAGLANNGQNYANLGTELPPDPPNTSSLSQVVATVAGGAYTFSFFLANDIDDPDAFFTAFFDGVQVFTTTTALFGTSGAYAQLAFNVIASTANTTIEFQYQHAQDFWRLDDVRARQQAVPESGMTLWLVLPVLAGLFLAHYRVARRSPVRVS